MRESPGGKVPIWLPEDAPILMLYRRHTINNREWIEVRNILNQTGWVPVEYVVIRP